MMNLIDRLVDWWMQRCPHLGEHVAADILEGDWDEGRVAYCRRCGATQIRYDMFGYMRIDEWRRPRPLWYPELATRKDFVRARDILDAQPVPPNITEGHN